MGLDISTGVYRARKKCKYTQAELGDFLGVNSNTISSWETGKTQPSMNYIVALSEISGLSINEIMCYGDYHDTLSGIRKARRLCGYTQKEMGKALKVESNTISQWERGVSEPSMHHIIKISEISGMKISEILRDLRKKR